MNATKLCSLGTLLGTAILATSLGLAAPPTEGDGPTYIWELMSQKGQLQQASSWDSTIFPGVDPDAKVIAIRKGPSDPGATIQRIFYYGATVGSNTDVAIGDEICHLEAVVTWEEIPGFDPLDRMLATNSISKDTCGWGMTGGKTAYIWQRVESASATTAGRDSALPTFALRIISISMSGDSPLPEWAKNPDRIFGDSPDISVSFTPDKMMNLEAWFVCDPEGQKEGLPYCDHYCDQGATVSEVDCKKVDWTAFRFFGQ